MNTSILTYVYLIGTRAYWFVNPRMPKLSGAMKAESAEERGISICKFDLKGFKCKGRCTVRSNLFHEVLEEVDCDDDRVRDFITH